jgi:asparagine synthase (glutamine-hydrolysing)
MCGIAGAIRRIPRREDGGTRPRSARVRGLVETLNQAISHRGPDGFGFWESPGQEVVFGHRRLAIIDLSEGGAQPKIEPDTGCAITFNGEIYNYLDLRGELEALGETFQSASDTEVILKAYKRWGIDAVRRFRGIFAFVLWDPRDRTVHLVRDPMGIKPLYWTLVRDPETGEELLLFASEVRALLQSGLVRRRLDPSAVASYLWHGFTVGPSTILDGVHLLPAASILTVEAAREPSGANTRRERQYWSLPASGARSATVSDLRDELRRAVRMQLIADVPLGVFLSGGVDSSAVAALASEVAPDSVHTFTIAFDVPEYDEARYARRVADAIKSRHTAVTLTEGMFLEQLPEAFTAIDQPTYDALNTYFVSRAAREAGMTVALAGTGGDELFGGYPSYVDIPRALRAGAWFPFTNGSLVRRTFDGAISAAARLRNAAAWSLRQVAPRQTRWAKVADVARALHDTLGLYQVSYALFTRETLATLGEGAVRDATAGQSYGLPPAVADAWRRRLAGSDPLHAVSLLELSSFVGERLLRDTDTASMAVALEVRVPLLDHVVIETAAGIDPVRRFEPIRRKQLLRDLALGGLDPAIFDRPKSGFVLPIDVWARQTLQPRMEALFNDGALAGRVGLRGEALRTLWRSFTSRRPGLHWSRVWALFVLLSWCERHDVSLAA